MDIGRCDLPGGNQDSLINSLKTKLYPIKEDLKVYPGHCESTTLFYEKENNIYFR